MHCKNNGCFRVLQYQTICIHADQLHTLTATSPPSSGMQTGTLLSSVTYLQLQNVWHQDTLVGTWIIDYSDVAIVTCYITQLNCLLKFEMDFFAGWYENHHTKVEVCSCYTFQVIIVLKWKFRKCTIWSLFSYPVTYRDITAWYVTGGHIMAVLPIVVIPWYARWRKRYDWQ